MHDVACKFACVVRMRGNNERERPLDYIMYTHLKTTDSPGAMFRATPTADHKLFHIPFSTTREEAAEPLS